MADRSVNPAQHKPWRPRGFDPDRHPPTADRRDSWDEETDLVDQKRSLTSTTLPLWAEVSWLKNLAVATMCAGLFALQVWVYLPDLRRDFAYQGQMVVASSAKVSTPSCRSVLMLLSFCSATVTAKPDLLPQTTRFMVSFTDPSRISVRPMVARGDPTITSTVGAAFQNLWNRMFTFVMLAVLLLSLTAVTVTRLLRGQYAGGPAHVTWHLGRR